MYVVKKTIEIFSNKNVLQKAADTEIQKTKSFNLGLGFLCPFRPLHLLIT